ncbi:MAG: hypothetical protein U1F53_05265 [Burkholderiaceae bacterium]
MPTRNARNGHLHALWRPEDPQRTPQGRPAAHRRKLRLLRLRGRRPRGRRLQPRLPAPFERCGEMLAPMLATIHNLHYYLALMQEVRDALDAGRFGELRLRFAADRRAGCEMGHPALGYQRHPPGGSSAGLGRPGARLTRPVTQLW